MPRYTLDTMRARGALPLVAAERARQALPVGADGEGRTPACDDAYVDGELANAAASYATTLVGPSEQAWPESWGPCPRMAATPTTDPAEVDARVTDLVRAGALILAELERVLRTGVA